METRRSVVMALACAMMLCGCATHRAGKSSRTSSDPAMPPSAMAEGEGRGMTEVRPERMLVWKGSLTIEVWNISNAVAKAVSIAEQQGGYVEQKSDRGEESASITLRIPTKTFKTAVASIETLGTVIFRSVESEDVTDQYIDVEARLKNKVVLRDRLKQLLEKATDVKDVLAIETELNRVQSDIDSMEGRIKALKGQVDYATVSLSLSRKPILGPLGYFFKGLWWGIEKLFVIRS